MTYDPRLSLIFNNTIEVGTSSISTSLENNSGSTINKYTPVILTSTTILPVDITNDTALSMVGLVLNDVDNGSAVEVASSGKIKDITTSASIGDVLFIAKDGSLTNVKPSIGVGSFAEGDKVIRVGVVAKNQDDDNKKDLIISISVEGQL